MANPNQSYIKKSIQKEDMKSTAFTFLSVSIIGALLLLLLDLDLLPLHLSTYNKVLYSAVLGIVFLIFFFIGLISLKNYRILIQETIQEEALTEQIRSWFFTNHTADSIDASLSLSSDAENYYQRYEKMRGILSQTYPELAENYMDYLIEDFYEQLFS